MHNRRLIRVIKYRNDPNQVAYIVAIADAAKAIALIQSQAATPSDEIEHLGPFSDALLVALNLGSGRFTRA